MKIAIIRKNYSPYGGAENYLNLVSENLQAQRHEVHIFSANHWPGKSTCIHRVRTIKKPSFLSNILFALNVRRTLKKKSFDSVLSFERTLFQDIYPAGKDILPELSNGVYRAGDGCHREWLNKRKTVKSSPGKLSFSINPHHLVMLYLERQCLLYSKAIIANSMMVKNDIIRHYTIPGERIHVIYNGVDLQRFHPAAKDKKAAVKNSLGLQNNKIILFVGADFERKGLPVLLKAFSMLDLKEARLIVAGKRAKTKYLSMIKKLGVESKVILWGPEQRIEKLYAIADVFVLPTIYDPFSNATLEAMASGLPVVTTSCNGASELIQDRIEGFVINNPLDAGTFAEKISTTLRQAEDMGEKAHSKAVGYSIEKAVKEIIKVIT